MRVRLTGGRGPPWRQSSADEGHDDQPEKIAGVEAVAFGVCWSLGLLQDFQLLDWIDYRGET